MSRGALNHAASASLIALVLLTLAWELWLAPLRPGGSWLVLKTLPLLLPLFGILRGSPRTCQWAPLLVLPYAAEGLVRGWTEPGLAGNLAWAEFALASLFVFSAAGYARAAVDNPGNQ
jgi:uncharacterized membrane protein